MILTDISASDLVLALDLLLSIVLAFVFALGAGFAWTRDRLGWVIFYYSVSIVALLFLIVWGIVFGQPIGEPIRFLVGGALAIGLAWKTWAIVTERRAGRRERMRAKAHAPDKEESKP